MKVLLLLIVTSILMYFLLMSVVPFIIWVVWNYLVCECFSGLKEVAFLDLFIVWFAIVIIYSLVKAYFEREEND